MRGRPIPWWNLWTLALLLGACVGASRTTSPPAAATCPACECQCDCSQGGTTPASVSGRSPTRMDVDDLVASANRKMQHGDGKGCLEDLDQVLAIDPRMERHLLISRAQCEMLVGKCQSGKKRLTRYYETELAMSPDRTLTTVEAMAAMRCRGGDSSARDQLLRALYELNDGAFVNRRSSRWCAERIQTARRLLPKVPPRDVDDTQVANADRSLHITAASCHARAGDCRAALAIFRELFPAQQLAQVKDPKTREEILRSTFESTARRCKGRI